MTGFSANYFEIVLYVTLAASFGLLLKNELNALNTI